MHTRILRAPGGTYGNFTPAYYQTLRAAGYRVFDWNVTAADTDPSRPSPAVIAANILGGCAKQRVAVVLMHDSPGHEHTALALRDVIRGLKREGFRFDVLTLDHPLGR